MSTRFHRLCWSTVFIVLGLFNACTFAAENTSRVFRAGAAVADITPTVFPTALAGGFQPIYSSKVLDPLNARALVLDDGTNRMAFLVIDSCLMPTELHEKFKDLICKETGIKRENICISTTHCHSAPALTQIHGATADLEYVKTLPERAVKAVVMANANLQPVRVGWGTAREPRFVFCRRFLMKKGTASTEPSAFTGIAEDVAQMNPGRQNPNAITRLGIPDQTVYVLAFQTLDGKPFALFANYSTHYAGTGPGVSADYFGLFCQRIGELLSAPKTFAALISNGTSADNNCIDFLQKAENQQFNMKTVADGVAQAAFKAYQAMEFKNWVPIRMVEEELTIAIRKPSAKELEEAKAYLAKLSKEGKRADSRTAIYANSTLLVSQLPPERSIKIQAIRIGNLGIVSLPCEVYNFTGHDIRAYSPLEPTFIISLANGYNGYVPTAESFELGGYTTWRTVTSILEPSAEPKMRQRALELLRKTVE